VEKRDRIFLVVSAFFFIFLYCVLTTPTPIQGPDIEARPLPNGCMVYSAAFQASLNARAVLDDRCYWSEMLAVKFKDSAMYHVVLLYEYSNSLWVYDCNQGSYKISSYQFIVDPWKAAELVFPYAEYGEITDALWLRSDLDHHDNYGYPQ
jgi:hypothetical protein